MDRSAAGNPFSDSFSRVSYDIAVPSRFVEEQELLYEYKSSRLRGQYDRIPCYSYMFGFSNSVIDTNSHGLKKINWERISIVTSLFGVLSYLRCL